MSRDIEGPNPLVNEVFGELMPEKASEDLDPDSVADQDERDRWLRENVPPHHH